MSTHSRTDRLARAARSSHLHDGLRLLLVVLSLLALLLTSSALHLVTEARAADAPKKAVVVAGPVHTRTDAYRRYCAAVADAAEAQGMDVVRIFHPWAPASKVRKLAQGANLFVYCGHGNGWPSVYGDFQEDTKDGLGLDVEDKDLRSPSNVVYKGANWLRANIRLAPDAVVILSHLSYASGNASSGMPIPSRGVAIQRVDNFANGFLSIGARVVWALGWQPGADVVNALFAEDASMDAVFMTRYRDADGANPNPLNGWIGWKPGYYDSVRIPGAVVHIDPHPTYGYLRGLTGDLAFTTTEWRGGGATRPADTIAPVASNVRAVQARETISGGDVPVFTPNGDGISDGIAIDFRLSEGAFVDVKVKRAGKALRHWSTWALGGRGKITWDGRKDGGAFVPEGNYNLYLTPTDRAGNVGATEVVRVKALDAVRDPRVRPQVFWARDDDARAATATLNARLTREAAVSWTIRDQGGNVVRRALSAEAQAPGRLTFVWDGRDDRGDFVPDGQYRARIWVRRPAGSYAHEVALRQTPYLASSPRWVYRRGETVAIQLTSTEPLQGKPVVTAKQPGISKYTVPRWKVKRISAKRFNVFIETRRQGTAGIMKVRIVGLDVDGGTNVKAFRVRLR